MPAQYSPSPPRRTVPPTPNWAPLVTCRAKLVEGRKRPDGAERRGGPSPFVHRRAGITLDAASGRRGESGGPAVPVSARSLGAHGSLQNPKEYEARPFLGSTPVASERRVASAGPDKDQPGLPSPPRLVLCGLRRAAAPQAPPAPPSQTRHKLRLGGNRRTPLAPAERDRAERHREDRVEDAPEERRR